MKFHQTVCALILWRFGLGLLMGRFRQLLTVTSRPHDSGQVLFHIFIFNSGPAVTGAQLNQRQLNTGMPSVLGPAPFNYAQLGAFPNLFRQGRQDTRLYIFWLFR